MGKSTRLTLKTPGGVETIVACSGSVNDLRAFVMLHLTLPPRF